MMPSLELDIYRSIDICSKAYENPEYAKSLYGALCNTQWVKRSSLEQPWSCSWRYAGEIVAKAANRGECYLDYYCCGWEGSVSNEIFEDFRGIGWELVEEDEKNE